MRVLVSVCVFLSMFSGSAFAQRGALGGDMFTTGDIRIRVIFVDDRAAGPRLLVQLRGEGSDSSVATAYTNEAGEVGFNNIPIGIYHAVVMGDGIETADSGSFEVDARKGAQAQFVSVRRRTDTAQSSGGPAMVSAALLNIPKKARQEFDKAGDCMTAHEWNKALPHLTKAVALYPKYVAAYSNLGVVYGQLDDPIHQREALEKAVSLDDRFAPALVNLARIDYRDKRFAEAEDLLDKAVRVDPANAQTLTLLAQAELVNQDYDGAIATAKKVNDLPHEHLAVIHYIAARALEFKHRTQDALAQLETFLQEEPDGPRAAQARREAAIIRSSAR